MRSSRLVVLSLAATAAVGTHSVGRGRAGRRRGFADSWYWGAYGERYELRDGSDRNLHYTAPTVGADWMLTRAKFALNIFADQSYFSTTSSVANPTGSDSARAARRTSATCAGSGFR